MNPTLNQLVKGLISANNTIPKVPINTVKLNSKNVGPGDLYIAIHGVESDGHDFIPEALKNGASAIITNGRDVGSLPVPQVKVANPRRAASLVAAEYYGHPSKELHVIGITGTNGKTSTATLIKFILDTAGYKAAQLGTLGIIADGYEQEKTLTTPDAVSLNKLFREFVDKGISHVVMEVSSHAIHQYRVADIEFETTIFTNLTPEHLDYHGSMEEYYHAKSKLFKRIPLMSTSIINVDDTYGQRLVAESTAPVLKASLAHESDIYFSESDSSLQGITGVIRAGEQSIKIESSLIGDFNKENILLSVGAALSQGVLAETISRGISACKIVSGRMERFSAPNGAEIIVDYAHTPDAYEKVLATVKSLLRPSGKMHVLFGCGGNRDASKRPEMGKIVEAYADAVFLTPDNPRNEKPEYINDDILKGFTGNNYEIFDNRGVALHKALQSLKAHDVLVVLGKGRESYQEIRKIRHSYSDINIIEEFCANHPS